MAEILRLIAAASPERAALLVLVIALLFAAAAIRALWQRVRLHEIELDDINDLQRRLLEAWIQEKSHGHKISSVDEKPLDPGPARPDPSAVDAGHPARTDVVNREIYVTPRLVRVDGMSSVPGRPITSGGE